MADLSSSSSSQLLTFLHKDPAFPSSRPTSCALIPTKPLSISSLHYGRRSVLLGSAAGFCCGNSLHRDGVMVDDGAVNSLQPIQMNDRHPPTFVSAPDRRIIAIGDLHGDIQQTRKALSIAGLISSDGLDKWVGGSAVLVQVGDILDRGGDEIAILSLLEWLNIQAQLKGGAVFQVNGNHETINVEGDFRYADPTGFYEMFCFMEFCEDECNGKYEAAFAQWRTVSQKRKGSKHLSHDWMPWNLLKMQKGMAARSFLFKPGGPLAKVLSRHGVVLKVNDWLFAHGGIHPHHVEYGLARINKEVSQWMLGAQNSFGQPVQIPFIATRGFDSIVWSRLYSRETYEDPNENIRACAVLRAALEAADAKGMVVGHTPQTLGANSNCKGQIWRIDVGMSSGMWNAQPEVLEIQDDKVTILTDNTFNHEERT